MKILYELIPIVIFFLVYKLYGIFAATLCSMLAALVQTSFGYIRHQRINPVQLLTFLLLLLMGGATLFSHNILFIKVKPTLLYGLLSLAFLITQAIGKRPLLQYFMHEKISLPATMWNKLNFSWGLFFLIMGAANLYVVYHYSTDTWVNFKLYGTLGASIVFMLLQSIYMAQHLHHESPRNP